MFDVHQASSGAAEVVKLLRLEEGLDFFVEAREMGDTLLGTSVPDPEPDEIEDDEKRNSIGVDSLFGFPSDSPILQPPAPPLPPPPGVHLYDGVSGDHVPSGVLRQRSPTFLLLGSEGRGLDPNLLRLCHFHVRINSSRTPTMTKNRLNNVDSLNVSVASGILLHHFVCCAV